MDDEARVVLLRVKAPDGSVCLFNVSFAPEKGLRHPSVEAARGSSLFIPNDVDMRKEGRLAIVTGDTQYKRDDASICCRYIKCLAANMSADARASSSSTEPRPLFRQVPIWLENPPSSDRLESLACSRK